MYTDVCKLILHCVQIKINELASILIGHVSVSLESVKCPVCDEDTLQCEICSGSNCTDNNTCEAEAGNPICYLELEADTDEEGTILTPYAGCGGDKCNGLSDGEQWCKLDCSVCTLCCKTCTESDMRALKRHYGRKIYEYINV